MSERRQERKNLVISSLLAFGIGATALYALDRTTDVVTQVEQALNPFDNESKPLSPESNELTISWLPETVQYWEETIVEYGEKYKVDPEYIAIIMTIESGGFSRAWSGPGPDARGLMQVTPDTASDIAEKHLQEPRESYDIWDPRTNIEFGVAYIAYLRDLYVDFSDDYPGTDPAEFIAAGYNGGPGAAIDLIQGNGLNSAFAEQTVQHSRDAFSMWRERKADSSPTYNRWLERGGQSLIDAAAAE